MLFFLLMARISVRFREIQAQAASQIEGRAPHESVECARRLEEEEEGSDRSV